MRKYIPHYTAEFVEEQTKWFEARMDRLPQSLQINPSTYSEDLRKTVQGILRILQVNAPHVTVSGYLETLLQIKDKLQQEGL